MYDVVAGIDELRKKRNAVILVHNYQRPEIQDIADFIGDSLGLSISATKTSADLIIFCGVDFMAESAAILNPDKIVIHPEPTAKCPMALMIDAEGLKELKKHHLNAATVAYVNTPASVKAEVDICCTSSNAVKVVKSMPQKEIIFVPDTNLGLYIKRFVSDKELILWPGYCPTHQNIQKEELLELKTQHPNAEIIVHPECIPEVIDIADFVYSTEGMVTHIKNAKANEFIIGTERELSYRLKKENPKKSFYPMPSAICPTMKKITLEKVLKSLESLEPKVILSKDIIKRARIPLERMMKIGRGD